MKRLLLAAAVALTVVSQAGCFFRTRNPDRHHHHKKTGCGPDHHWNGRACVRDHRR